jgi:hypothetical protein
VCVGDVILCEGVFEVDGVLDLVRGLNGDGGEDVGEEFGGRGGQGVTAGDNGAEGVLALVIGGFVDFLAVPACGG